MPKTCDNPTCSKMCRGRYCSRRCQVACLNSAGYYHPRIKLTMDDVHTLEAAATAEGMSLGEYLALIVTDEVDVLRGAR